MTDGFSAPVRSRLHGAVARRREVIPHAVVWVAVIVLNLIQQPGRITFDTKLDLQIDPAGFLARSTELWNADWALGGLQNQASGYLFPMGPVFWLGDVIGVPMWVWERLWSAFVMLLAYEGARRLAGNWPGITRQSALLAGLVYMLSPRALTTVGSLSSETLPGSILPWTLLPLVLYLRGRMRGWVAFVLSAASVVWMGGQNATVTAACLVLPALLLAFASERTLRRRVGDLAAWGSLIGLATLWWVFPLLLQGAYAPNFLDFIESADTTAGDVGWFAALRGTSHWVAFFGDVPAGWSGGHALASSGPVAFASLLVAALGLAGLLRPTLWQRKVLVLAMLIGLAVMTAGSSGWAGSPFADQWLDALDNSLAPLRNIHKFDPLVRLPLALGVASLASQQLPGRLRGALHPPVRIARMVLIVAVVSVASGPSWAGALRSDDGFEEIPSAWLEAVAFIKEQDGPTRTMLLPAGTFAVNDWGRTIDEPMQVLRPDPWLARIQVTVASAGTVRLVESVEDSAGQARLLRRTTEALRGMGITHVIVRHDLVASAGASEADRIRVGISALPGARLLETFGTQPGGGPMLEVYELAHDREPRIGVQDWAGRAEVSGAPEVLPDLRAVGLVGRTQAAVLTSPDDSFDVLTDSLRRVERNFATAVDDRSEVMTAGEPFRLRREAHDLLDEALSPGLTTAEYEGATQILASSSTAYAGNFGAVRPDEHPYAAFDSSIYTSWVSAPLVDPVGQWIEVHFDEPTDVSDVALTFDASAGSSATSVRVSTQAETLEAQVGATGAVSGLDLGKDATRLRVAITEASSRGPVRLADIRIAGHEISRSLRLPGELEESSAMFASSRAPGRSCIVDRVRVRVECEVANFRDTTESAGFERTVTVAESGQWRFSGLAVATHGPVLDRLFAPLDEAKVKLAASSTFGGDPAVNASAAMDGDLTTSWLATPADREPVLALDWGPQRTVSSIRATLIDGAPGELPKALRVSGGPGTGRPQRVLTSGPRAGQMRPITTTQLRIKAVGTPETASAAISELSVSGLSDLVNHVDLDGPTGTMCGFGPSVEIDGLTVQTRITGTVQDIRSGAELDVVGCGQLARSISPGEHRIRVINPPGFVMTALLMTPPPRPRAAVAGTPQVLDWHASERRVAVRAVGESVLGVRQVFNHGWEASVAGEPLRSVVLDGWRQGFVLPAGTDGVVDLEYRPQRLYQTSLLVGLLLAGVLLILGAVLLVRWFTASRDRDRFESSAVEPDREGSAPAPVRLPTRWRLVGSGLLLIGVAAVSLPLSFGVLIGGLGRRVSLWVVSAVGTGLLLVAAVLAAASGEIVIPPQSAELCVAVAVGLFSGRALIRR